MDKKLLEELIKQKMSQKQISLRTGNTQTKISYWMNKYGIKPAFNNRPRQSKSCRYCGETKTSKFYPARQHICKACKDKNTNLVKRRKKQIMVDEKGGKCAKCGYNKCLAALDFHHLDPKQKDPDYAKLRERSLGSLRKELEKCIILCRNCHAEEHYKEITL